MVDRSSRPHRSPRRTPQPVVRKIVHLRWKQRLGPVAIADGSGMPASTVHAVLVRCRLNRLCPRRPGHRGADPPLRARPPRRRCSTSTSRSSATSPTAAAGATSAASRATGTGPRPRASRATRTATRKIGHRVRAHRASTTTPGSPTPRSTTTRPPPPPSRVLRRAVAWFAARGVTVERVLSDNGSCLPSATSGATPAPSSASPPKRTRPYRPQTNGKIERFHRTLADGWAFKTLLQLRDQPAATPCQHGSTSTTTTGPTPRSARPRPSPA